MAPANRAKAVPAGLIVLAAVVCSVGPVQAEAETPFRFRAEVGLGGNRAPRLEAASAVGAGVLLSAGPRWRGPWTPLIEGVALIADGAPSGIPEKAKSGRRTFYSGTLGFERALFERRAIFASLGVGAGHYTLKGARPATGTVPWIATPDRSATTLAGSAGVGWRAGSGPVHFQWALRGHALFDAGEVPFASYLLTAGIAF